MLLPEASVGSGSGVVSGQPGVDGGDEKHLDFAFVFGGDFSPRLGDEETLDEFGGFGGVGRGRFGDAGGGHVSVADGFDSFDFVAGGDGVEEAGVGVELVDELAGFELFGDGG